MNRVDLIKGIKGRVETLDSYLENNTPDSMPRVYAKAEGKREAYVSVLKMLEPK